MSLSIVNDFIAKSSELKVAVVGETIIDEFVEVDYEGQSMKSFCPVFKLTGVPTQQQQGGAAAIANHLRDFVNEIKIITNTQNEIVKTRYVDSGSGQKHIEVNKFQTHNFPEINIDTNDYDVVIVADFGHGFCDKLTINDGFFVMTQTNSNNFGFNRVSKWKNKRKSGVCIDLREASLQMNKKFNQPSDKDIEELYKYELNTETLFVTLGKKGSVYYDGSNCLWQQSYPSDVVDTIGAGDAFFGFACLISALKNKLPVEKSIPIPALAASLTTTWLCNEQSVTKEKLKNYATKFI